MDLFAGLANRAESLLEKIDGQAARTADYSDSDEEGDELYYDDEEDYDDEDDDENAKDEVTATRHVGADREGLYKDHERLNDGAQAEHSSSAAWKWEAQRVADRLQSAKRYVARSVTPVSFASLAETGRPSRGTSSIGSSEEGEGAAREAEEEISDDDDDDYVDDDHNDVNDDEVGQGDVRENDGATKKMGNVASEADDDISASSHKALPTEGYNKGSYSGGDADLPRGTPKGVDEDVFTNDAERNHDSEKADDGTNRVRGHSLTAIVSQGASSMTNSASSASLQLPPKPSQESRTKKSSDAGESESARRRPEVSGAKKPHKTKAKMQTEKKKKKHERTSSTSSTPTTSKRAQVQASQSRHIEALEAELRTLDEQMVSMQADLDAAHEALEKSRKGARAQESKLRKERDDLLAEAKRKQKELQATIKARDRTISDHEHELGELRGALDEFDADYEELQQKYDAREKEFKDKQREMQQNSQASQVEELEQELAAAQTAAEVARREFSVQVNEAERRIAELEHQNSELSVELAATQRKLDDRDESDWNAQERSALENDHQNALYEAQEAQRHAEEMLAQERRRIAALQQDVDAVHAEAERAASRKAQEEQRWQAESRQLRDQVDALKRDLNAMRKRDDIQGVAALEQRLAALSEHLVAKQKQIESLTSEKGALRQRLKSLERQHEELRLQEQVSNGAGRRGAGTAGYGGDVELGSVSLRFRRRQETAAMRIARLEPIAQHQNLAEAVDVVDQLALSSGAVLQREPWVRLMFLGYFLLLHLWVIFILVFHTHGTVPVEVARYSIPDAREAALPTVGP